MAEQIDRWAATSSDRQTIEAFLDWLAENGVHLGENSEKPPYFDLNPTLERRDAMLARYFEIDLNQLERERRAMLASLSASN